MSDYCVPGIEFCNDSTMPYPTVPSKIAIGSSVVSCLGSIMIFGSFVFVKEFRTGAHKIMAVLAVADFLTSFGYVLGSVNYLKSWSRPRTDVGDCKTFEDFCRAQSLLTTWSSMCSQGWTCYLAAYFLLVTCRPCKLGTRAFVWSNFLVWGLPLVPVVALLGTRQLGYSRMTAAGWCFVDDRNRTYTQVVLTTLVGGKFTEILTYIFVVLTYLVTMLQICKVK